MNYEQEMQRNDNESMLYRTLKLSRNGVGGLPLERIAKVVSEPFTKEELRVLIDELEMHYERKEELPL